MAITLSGACGLGLVLTLFMHRSEWAHPVLARLVGSSSPENPLPLRRLDPTCRLRGWRTLAAEVDRLRMALRQEGVEAELAASGWTLPGELGFYCEGHPVAYSLGLGLGDRHSQYDLWRPNPLADVDAFRGRTFIFVGNVSSQLKAGFQEVDTPLVVTHVQNGEPLAEWTVSVCRGFRGLPSAVADRLAAESKEAHRW
jgi:hypothetical protein